MLLTIKTIPALFTAPSTSLAGWPLPFLSLPLTPCPSVEGQITVYLYQYMLSMCFLFYDLLIYFLAALDLRCCVQAFSSWVSRSYSSFQCLVFSLRWLLLLQSTGSRHRLQQLQHTDSVVEAHGLSCSIACGIFPDQESNSCTLPWQADSYPLYHQASP